MAEAHAQGRNLLLAMVCFLGFSGPVAGQAPTQVDQHSIPPSSTGQLGESDVARAVAMIRDLGTTFAVLGARERIAEARARWDIYRRAYRGSANLLDAMLADGRIAIRDLPETEPAAISGDGIVLDSTLGGRWRPNAVRLSRRTGAGDWADISGLAGVLVVQQVLASASGAGAVNWDAWSAAHDRTSKVQGSVGETPDRSLRPLLVRFWHIQDKYLANALADMAGDSAGGPRMGRAATLSNEMLGVLKQVESAGGWRWRKPLETVWGKRDTQAQAILSRAMPVPAGVPATVPAGVPAPTKLSEAAPPRSGDFDKLFAEAEPAPLVTAAGPVEDINARADIDALYRENSARQQDAQDLTARLGGLSSQVTALAAIVAGQGRQLETLAGDIAIAQTTPKALAALTASLSALERRLADLGREVGPDGVSGQLAALQAAMDSAQSQSRDAAQRLETRFDAQVQTRVEAQVEKRLRQLSREVEATQSQANELQAKLSALRPSAAAAATAVATAVDVPLQNAAARRNALRQAVIAGTALLVLLLFAIVFWVRGARQRADDAALPELEPADAEGLSRLMAGLHSADRNALHDELTQLRADTRTVSQGLLDSAARDQARGGELAELRQAIETERARARGLQSLVDGLRPSAEVAKATPRNDVESGEPGEPGRDDKDAFEPAVHTVSPPAIVELAERRRAIEALHRGDLPGFEQAFARLTALPLTSVERIVRHSSGRDLALACRAVGIAKAHLAAILVLSRRAQTGEQQLGSQRLAPRQLAEAISVFDESSAETATLALQGWRAAGR